MRLLHIETLELVEFHNNIPPYVITSHRWLPDELTFQDVGKWGACMEKHGYKKIKNFCKTVKWLCERSPNLERPLEWMWIDTVCIDKRDSVELQEALKSMCKWYAEAVFCIAWLHDVRPLSQKPRDVIHSIRDSVWFKRGWSKYKIQSLYDAVSSFLHADTGVALQELVAPSLVVFLDGEWEPVGHKKGITRPRQLSLEAVGLTMNDLISEITGIPSLVLEDFSKADGFEIEEKRSWMQNRMTTRVEDMVYCQLGIFGVFMPLIYGEGEYAMVRLEEALGQKAKHARDLRKSALKERGQSEAKVSYVTGASPSKIDFTIHAQIGESQHRVELCRTIAMAEGQSVRNLRQKFESLWQPEIRQHSRDSYNRGKWRLLTTTNDILGEDELLGSISEPILHFRLLITWTVTLIDHNRGNPEHDFGMLETSSVEDLRLKATKHFGLQHPQGNRLWGMTKEQSSADVRLVDTYFLLGLERTMQNEGLRVCLREFRSTTVVVHYPTHSRMLPKSVEMATSDTVGSLLTHYPDLRPATGRVLGLTWTFHKDNTVTVPGTSKLGSLSERQLALR